MLLVGDEWVIAPIASQCSGLAKTNLTHDVRRVVLKRDNNKKYGLRMRAVNKGVFVQLVTKDSPSAAAGIRFGDQVLSLNGTEMLGMTGQKAMELMKKTKRELVLIVRDRFTFNRCFHYFYDCLTAFV
ncbi:unnamed protein product, partial [Gongylonema pulchrum]|uniref:PDZ domain-containing protein n=1 Tax=Gongylonema pulchrum TaxID=637853 RepID=A0A183DGF7_9BILA